MIRNLIEFSKIEFDELDKFEVEALAEDEASSLDFKELRILIDKTIYKSLILLELYVFKKRGNE